MNTIANMALGAGFGIALADIYGQRVASLFVAAVLGGLLLVRAVRYVMDRWL
jgi:hypothetical protein